LGLDEAHNVTVPVEVKLELAQNLIIFVQRENLELQRRIEVLTGMLRPAADAHRPEGAILQ
jgi:hypothetical protein